MSEQDRSRTFLVAQGAEAKRGVAPVGGGQEANESAARVAARTGVVVAGRPTTRRAEGAERMTDATEPTVRYWRDPSEPGRVLVLYTPDYFPHEGSPWESVHVLTDAELDAIKAEVAESIARRIEAVDPIEWALAGQHAGADAARIARTYTESED